VFLEEDPLLRQLLDFGLSDGLEGLRESPVGCHHASRVMNELRIVILGMMVMKIMVDVSVWKWMVGR
jgi:hypothetical protein